MKDPEVLGAETRRALLLAKGKKKRRGKGAHLRPRIQNRKTTLTTPPLRFPLSHVTFLGSKIEKEARSPSFLAHSTPFSSSSFESE